MSSSDARTPRREESSRRLGRGAEKVRVPCIRDPGADELQPRVPAACAVDPPLFPNHRAPVRETARKRTQAPLRKVSNVRASFRLEESSGALSHEEESLMVRYMSDATQSQEIETQKRLWERWRDTEKKKGNGERGGKVAEKGRKGGNEGGQEAGECGVSGSGARRGTSFVRKRKKEKGMERRILREERRSKGWYLGKIGKLMFLFLLVTRNFGVASAASEDIQNGEGKMEDGQWKKENAGNGWCGKEKEERFQEQTWRKDRSEMRKCRTTRL